ncbi:MAG: hypothetical protein ABWJ98_02570 [Hydrogenothermaceae bacterium]
MLKESVSKKEEKLELLNRFFGSILKEVLNFSKKFPEAQIYINTTEPFLYLEVVYNFRNLSKENKEQFFGFEYRINKALKTIIDEDIPFIEVNFTEKLENPHKYIKIT